MSQSLANSFVDDMEWKLKNDMSGISESPRPQFRVTPAGFSANRICWVTQTWTAPSTRLT
jgi:hypothetical protein